MNVYALPKAERDIWMQTIQPYTDELMAELGAETAAQLKDIAARANGSSPYEAE